MPAEDSAMGKDKSGRGTQMVGWRSDMIKRGVVRRLLAASGNLCDHSYLLNDNVEMPMETSANLKIAVRYTFDGGSREFALDI